MCIFVKRLLDYTIPRPSSLPLLMTDARKVYPDGSVAKFYTCPDELFFM